MLTFVEVLTGPIDDDTHIGKMLVYLNELLELNPIRGHVYGALTNLEHAAVYHCIRGYKIGYCQPIHGKRCMHWQITASRSVVHLAKASGCVACCVPSHDADLHHFSGIANQGHMSVYVIQMLVFS